MRSRGDPRVEATHERFKKHQEAEQREVKREREDQQDDQSANQPSSSSGQRSPGATRQEEQALQAHNDERRSKRALEGSEEGAQTSKRVIYAESRADKRPQDQEETKGA